MIPHSGLSQTALLLLPTVRQITSSRYDQRSGSLPSRLPVRGGNFNAHPLVRSNLSSSRPHGGKRGGNLAGRVAALLSRLHGGKHDFPIRAGDSTLSSRLHGGKRCRRRVHGDLSLSSRLHSGKPGIIHAVAQAHFQAAYMAESQTYGQLDSVGNFQAAYMAES